MLVYSIMTKEAKPGREENPSTIITSDKEGFGDEEFERIVSSPFDMKKVKAVIEEREKLDKILAVKGISVILNNLIAIKQGK